MFLYFYFSKLLNGRRCLAFHTEGAYYGTDYMKLLYNGVIFGELLIPNFVVNLECFATKYGTIKKLDRFAIQTTEFGRNFSLSGVGYTRISKSYQ